MAGAPALFVLVVFTLGIEVEPHFLIMQSTAKLRSYPRNPDPGIFMLISKYRTGHHAA
jgi:hypothetical protein